ncbi:MAG: hypothetical protein ACFCD0_17030 [Gemmataceae bacterium]
MTEKQWLACTRPDWMLEHVRTKMSHRKLRLFAVACCRRTEQLFLDERCDTAVEVAELFADGLATQDERKQAAEGVRACRQGLSGLDESYRAVRAAHLAASFLCAAFPFESAQAALTFCPRAIGFMSEDYLTTQRQEEELHCQLLRDIAGNPFQKIRLDRTWLTSDTTLLAHAIYQRKRFGDLPILADALEEAGCTHEGLLAHCRENQTHVRGCWVIDLLLGNS